MRQEKKIARDLLGIPSALHATSKQTMADKVAQYLLNSLTNEGETSQDPCIALHQQHTNFLHRMDFSLICRVREKVSLLLGSKARERESKEYVETTWDAVEREKREKKAKFCKNVARQFACLIASL